MRLAVHAMLDECPRWLVLPSRDPSPLMEMERLLEANGLHTVCGSAGCPNQLECFERRTCTFMILGDVCTRGCRFCGVGSDHPMPVDGDEPRRIAHAVRLLSLRHVVVTSVTRDDLPDGGAAQFVATAQELRRLGQVSIELLVPDFRGRVSAIERVIAASPELLGHNIETVPRLYSSVRPGAAYERSLRLLAMASESASISKSGLMLGLGESRREVVEVLADLRAVGCEVVTIGQYLRPAHSCLPVRRYIPPEEFAELQDVALSMGFRACVAGPLTRSSYHSETMLHELQAI